MKLKEFTIRNFRSVTDSEKIRVSQPTTVFIGANRAGKSSLLKGLSKLSLFGEFGNFDLTEVAGLSNRYFNGEVKGSEIPIVEATFSLGDGEFPRLEGINSSAELSITRFFDGSMTVKLGSELIATLRFGEDLVNFKKLAEVVKKLRTEFTPHLARPPNAPNTQAFSDILTSIEASAKAVVVDKDAIEKSYAALLGLSLDTPAQVLLKSRVDQMRPLTGGLIAKGEKDGIIAAFLKDALPRMVYFSSYDRLEDKVTLEELERNPSGHSTMMSLLRLGGVNIEVLKTLEVQRATLYLENASTRINSALNLAWTEEPTRIKLSVSAGSLVVMIVSHHNETAPVPIPPSCESEGFQWFLGLFINFADKAGSEYTSAILLLDDLGIHLHPRRQRNLLSFVLDQFKDKVTAIYATHLPFLIPIDEPDRIRLITRDNGVTRVTERFHAETTGGIRSDAFAPIRAALGFDLMDSLFVGTSTLLVEGISDQIILNALVRVWTPGSSKVTSDGLLVVGQQQSSTLLAFAEWLQANRLPFAVMLDNDDAGRRTQEQLLKQGISEERVCLLPEQIARVKSNFSIEDLFPVEVLAEAFLQVYPGIRDLSTQSIQKELEGNPKSAWKILEGICVRSGISFDKVQFSRAISRVILSRANDPRLQEVSKALFGLLNAKLG